MSAFLLQKKASTFNVHPAKRLAQRILCQTKIPLIKPWLKRFQISCYANTTATKITSPPPNPPFNNHVRHLINTTVQREKILRTGNGSAFCWQCFCLLVWHHRYSRTVAKHWPLYNPPSTKRSFWASLSRPPPDSSVFFYQQASQTRFMVTHFPLPI